jgi:2-hydroxychromene-2-carboxylate isomerase
MGNVISLAERRASRSGSAHGAHGRLQRARATFFFDVSSPWTYLAAERADRMFTALRWRPVLADALAGAEPVASPAVETMRRRAVEERAAALRLPLVWPETWPNTGRSAMRVAALAAEQDRAAPFVLAAGRLAFCGGYDIDDPETLAEAAAVAGIGLDEALAAARDHGRDAVLEREALRLTEHGADTLPALRVGRTLFCGEHRLAEASAAASAVTVHRPARMTGARPA